MELSVAFTTDFVVEFLSKAIQESLKKEKDFKSLETYR